MHKTFVQNSHVLWKLLLVHQKRNKTKMWHHSTPHTRFYITRHAPTSKIVKIGHTPTFFEHKPHFALQIAVILCVFFKVAQTLLRFEDAAPLVGGKHGNFVAAPQRASRHLEEHLQSCGQRFPVGSCPGKIVAVVDCYLKDGRYQMQLKSSLYR